MVQPLNEFFGLPEATDLPVLYRAFEARFNALLERSSHGDNSADAELVRLRLAYLNWAYRTPQNR